MVPGARLNYVDQVMRFADRPGAAVVSIAEDGSRGELSWPQLRAAVAGFASALRSMGVEQGDRVVGYLPNAQESVIAFLATASLGATWAGCAPDYGVSAAADRLQQLEPTVLVAATAYRFDGKVRDRREEVAALVERLGVRAVVTVPRAARCRARRFRPGASRALGRRLLRGLRRAAHHRAGARPSIRCGSCSRPAPPAFRRGSCTVTPAWSR